MATAAISSQLIPNVDAAAFLGVTPGTLDVWRCTRRYPLAYVRVGRKIMYRISDLEAFLAARTVNPLPAVAQ